MADFEGGISAFHYDFETLQEVKLEAFALPKKAKIEKKEVKLEEEVKMEDIEEINKEVEAQEEKPKEYSTLKEESPKKQTETFSPQPQKEYVLPQREHKEFVQKE